MLISGKAGFTTRNMLRIKGTSHHNKGWIPPKDNNSLSISTNKAQKNDKILKRAESTVLVGDFNASLL